MLIVKAPMPTSDPALLEELASEVAALRTAEIEAANRRSNVDDLLARIATERKS